MEQRSLRVEALCQTLNHLQLAEMNEQLAKEPAPEIAISLLLSPTETPELMPLNLFQNKRHREAEKCVKPWSVDEIDALIKAVKQFPPGTVDRWAKITSHLNKHGASHEIEDVIRESAALKDTAGSTSLAYHLHPASQTRSTHLHIHTHSSH